MGHRISKVTTRTGDNGTTGLADGARVSKSAPRIDALGEIDEFNATLGALRSQLVDAEYLDRTLEDLQQRVFDLGGAIAIPGTKAFDSAVVEELEGAIEHLNDELPPLANFVLPAGDEATVRAHLARTVCRRAERALVRLAEAEPGRDDPLLLTCLNRASDLLFVIARVLARQGGGEVLWAPRPKEA